MENEILVKPIDGNATSYIQNLISEASKKNLNLFFLKGDYHISSIFLESNMNLFFEQGCRFIAITDDTLYPLIDTRIAGIEMPFYPAILNIIDKKNVILSGHLIIDGNGEYWWNKYWGKNGYREKYDKASLRWACDYDCKRPRNLLVQNSYNININGLESKDSGFWNIHILYSHKILLNNIVVNSDNPFSPSTDGIDIDSSYDVEVLNSTINTNDDNIAIKSGRDSDGLRVNIPSHDIIIKDTIINKGYGITFGSELSGGIYNVEIDNIVFNNTDCGLRIKSSYQRKGYVKNISFKNIVMNNVKYLFHINLDWNKGYSLAIIPENSEIEIKDYYYTIAKKVSDEIPPTYINTINVSNLKANVDSGCIDSRIFNISGYENKHLNNLNFDNMNITAYEYGVIEYTDNLSINNSQFTILGNINKNNDEFDNR